MMRPGARRAAMAAFVLVVVGFVVGFSLIARLATVGRHASLLPAGAGVAVWSAGVALVVIGLVLPWWRLPRTPPATHPGPRDGTIPRPIRRAVRRGGTAPDRYRPQIIAWLGGHRQARPLLVGNLIWTAGVMVVTTGVQDQTPAGLCFTVLGVIVLWILPGMSALEWHRRWVTRAERRHRPPPVAATPA